MFDPHQPFTSSGAVTSSQDVIIVQQGLETYFIKSFRAKRETSAAECMARELEAIAGFKALGLSVLTPIAGPFVELQIEANQQRLDLTHVLVYPFTDQSTLAARVDTSHPDALQVIEEAGRRIAARHQASASLITVHSDGAPHNIFQDWVWFDFGDPHRSQDLALAKAHELWRFVTGCLAVNSVPSLDQAVVAVFHRGYGDARALALARTSYGYRNEFLRLLAHPLQLYQWQRGDGAKLQRIRASRAIAQVLKNLR